MNKLNYSSTLLLLILLSLPFCLQAQVEYVGSTVCMQCHQEEGELWQQSHHWHSMELASDSSVLGDFANAEFDYFGTVSEFYTRDNKFLVKTDNAKGQLQEFEIKYTFGIYPLQQYLIEFPDGRIQALSISWDSRTKEEGGQRWYHLYPDEKVDHSDILHWTGAFQNWNSRCASCHSTNLQKNYSQTSDTYNTSFSEINVACESCHGEGSQHLAWAKGDGDISFKGLVNAVQKIWSPVGISPKNISNLISSLPGTNEQASSTQKDVCASCHSRRAEYEHRDLSKRFLDQNQLSMLTEGLYHADGQILDEVYVYGSFLQSKMHQSQVSCSNCHEPHTQKLLIEGNGLCTQCHSEELFDTKRHFFHESDSAGAQCVNCHMPTTTYMGVDARRDHSFKIPDPFFSLLSSTPNACTKCHLDKSDTWAAQALTDLKGRSEPYYLHAEFMQKARANDPFNLAGLLSIIRDQDLPTITRATALLESERYPTQETVIAAVESLQAQEPLIRSNAVASLSYLPISNRYQVLQPFIKDPVKSVRMEVAKLLAETPIEQLPSSMSQELETLFEEYIEAALFNADLPGAMSDLAVFYMNRKDYLAAESSFKQALHLSPAYLAAMLNIADLYRILGRDDEGELILQEAVALYPESANVQHALGLLYVRKQEVESSLPYLAAAVNLDLESARFVLVYTLALERVGDVPKAVEVLRDAVRRFPNDNQLYEMLREYSSRR